MKTRYAPLKGQRSVFYLMILSFLVNSSYSINCMMESFCKLRQNIFFYKIIRLTHMMRIFSAKKGTLLEKEKNTDHQHFLIYLKRFQKVFLV